MTGFKLPVLLSATALLAISCQVGPEYQRPELPMTAGYKGADKAKESTTQSAATQKAPQISPDWWRVFGDPRLDELETAALKESFTLQAAMARVAQARAAADVVRSGLFPVISANPSVNRSRSTSSSGHASTGNRVQLPVDLSYELDVWGRVRRLNQAAEAQAQQSIDDLGVVRLTLTSDLAQNYLRLRSLDAQEQIFSRTLESFRAQLELVLTQQKAGLAGPTVISQAQTQLDSTQTQLLEIRRQRASLEHALAILVGRPPAELSLAAHPLESEPPVIPSGLPSELLRQRPDVASAEEQLVAANAQVGVAKANFYPRFTLTSAAGLGSFDLQHALDWQSRIWSLGANATIPIFQGGQLEASLRQAKARYEEVLANFRQTLLVAFRDVEDALTDLELQAQEAQSQARAVASAREYLRLTRTQYQQGFATYLQVIDAERTLLTNELSATQILNQRQLSTLQLIKAVGGGWQCR